MPVVSIIVATYNSAKFVIETLESAKEQSWKHLELIVSDDCSFDNTVELCRQWIDQNKDRFVRTELITVPKNTGISANCNRCINAAQTNWIKFIAGDDILLPNCIEDNVKFVLANPEAKIIFSGVLLYQNDFKKENFLHIIPGVFPMNLMNPAFTANHQYKLLLLSDRITYTPSVFLNCPALLEVGGYDEANRLIEDYPMWLNLTRAGYRMYYFKQPTVGYRKHEGAISYENKQDLFKPLLLKAAAIRKKLAYPNLPWDIVAGERQLLLVSRVFQRLGMNKNTPLNLRLYKIATVYLNPFRYIVFIKKRVLKMGKENMFYAD